MLKNCQNAKELKWDFRGLGDLLWAMSSVGYVIKMGLPPKGRSQLCPANQWFQRQSVTMLLFILHTISNWSPHCAVPIVMSLSLFAAQYQYQCMEKKSEKKKPQNSHSEYICKYMWMNLIFCKGLLFDQISFSFNRIILFFCTPFIDFGSGYFACVFVS